MAGRRATGEERSGSAVSDRREKDYLLNLILDTPGRVELRGFNIAHPVSSHPGGTSGIAGFPGSGA